MGSHLAILKKEQKDDGGEISTKSASRDQNSRNAAVDGPSEPKVTNFLLNSNQASKKSKTGRPPRNN